MVKSGTKPKGATSYKDTAFGIISREELIKLEIEGIKRGLEYLYDLVQKQEQVAITSELITKLHEISFGWIFPKWAGKYRTIQVTFSDKEAPPYYQVSELMFNFSKDIESRLQNLPTPDKENFIFEIISLSAWFQHRFVFIHPFQDYNGRTARMLTTFILLQFKLPSIELKADTGDDRKQYLKAMRKADDGDYKLLERLISRALTDSLNHI